MINDCYQAALATLRHHLDEAGTPYSVDEGELIVADHRLGLAIGFEGFVPQGRHVLAPLDIQMHVDGDSGDKFRVGTLGVGADEQAAMKDAIAEWHLLAASPVLSALGASIEKRRSGGSQQLAGWELFPGSAGMRGKVPAELQSGGSFYRTLLNCLHRVVADWEHPGRFSLRSIFVLASCDPTQRDIQAAVDGLLDDTLCQRLSEVWPAAAEACLYKQLFVLRSADPA